MRTLLTVGTLILTAVLVLNIYAAAAGRTIPEITTRLDMIENQLTYLSCINLIPPEGRTIEAVAVCQVTGP